MLRSTDFLRRTLSGEEELWKIWWLGGIPVALAATAFTLSAELLRMDGFHAWGNFLDVLKLLAYSAWLTAAWRCSRNAGHPFARIATRLAVAVGIITAALTV